MVWPPAGDIALVVVGALIAGFVNGLTGTAYALVAMSFWLSALVTYWRNWKAASWFLEAAGMAMSAARPPGLPK